MSEANPTGVRRDRLLLLVVTVGAAIIALLLALLYDNIRQRKEEARNPYMRFVQVTEDTTDPEPWGVNWPREYDTYKKTAELTRTRFGGHGGSEALPVEKAARDPWLTRFFAGYAFSIDYRDRRGHYYMLADQEQTRRVTERPQPGACLHCHSSVMPTYRRIGEGDVMKGFELVCAMTYKQAHEELVKTGSMNPQIEGSTQKMVSKPGAHPVSCVDCHDPKSMQLRVTRPGFIRGITALAAGEGPVLAGSSIEAWRKGSREKAYDPNVNATRQEMRSYVCAQCHVEYYCGPKLTLLFPWQNGLKVEEIEKTYQDLKFKDGHRFYDWTHSETGAELLKAQHPEFELYSQGVHARSGVSCADCHMPYERQGAMKVSDHWVRSPLLNIARACQTCHPFPESELKGRVEAIQKRNFDLLDRGGKAVVEFFDSMKAARAPFDQQNRAAAEDDARKKLGAKAADAKLLASTTQQVLNERWARKVQEDPALKAIAELHRKGQWRLDFVAAENSMGFHAPQEAARILGESIDYFRQAQLATLRYRTGATPPATQPIQVPTTQAGITGPLDPNQSKVGTPPVK